MPSPDAQEEMMREITRLHETLQRKDEELARLGDRLRGLLRIKDRFLALATHDIRTPITTLKLIGNVVERNLDQLPDMLQRTLGTLPRNVAKLEAKVDDIIRIVRLGEEHPHLHPVETDLNMVVREAVASCIASAVQRGIELDLCLGDPVRAWVDVAHARQMVTDLIRTSMDRLDLRGHQRVGIDVNGDEVDIGVTDSGPVMPAAYLETLKAELAGSDEERRMRVPLFLANQVAVAHGGRVVVESRDKAMRFSAVLPRTGPRREGAA